MNRWISLFPLWALAFAAAQAADWPLFDRDPARSGDAGDGVLTPANVVHLHRRWHVKLDAVADNAPIVAGGRLFATAKDGTTYALDVASGHVLWRFATQGPKITTSVPAFDASSDVLYAGGVDGYIHKLDPATGRESRGQGFPEQITLAPQTEKNASPLNLANGYLYAQTSGYIGDATPYVGHVIAIRLSDGTKHVFNSLCGERHTLIEPQACPQQRSGMWSRSGVVVDPDPTMRGRIYGATGNGAFDAGNGNYGDSVIALRSDASELIDYYTPSNYNELQAGDLDVGSSSPALLPRQSSSKTPLMAVQGGKDSILRLLDRTHLGAVGHTLQDIQLDSELFSAPAVWTDATGSVWVFVGLADGIHAYRLETSNGTSRLASDWHASIGSYAREGMSPVVSNGVVFAASSGGIFALDARNGHQLWSDAALGPIHWESPALANGALFCSDENGYLSAYALTSASP